MPKRVTFLFLITLFSFALSQPANALTISNSAYAPSITAIGQAPIDALTYVNLKGLFKFIGGFFGIGVVATAPASASSSDPTVGLLPSDRSAYANWKMAGDSNDRLYSRIARRSARR